MTDADYLHIGSILDRIETQGAMNLEMLDGFFAALICGPETVLPNEYIPEIWGGVIAEDAALNSNEKWQDFVDLIMRHWNEIARTLYTGDVFLPLLLEDDDGNTRGNDWAQGFMRGMEMRHDGWGALVNDDENGGSLVPILALAHEHDPDPELHPYNEPIDNQQRENLIAGAAAGVMMIYRYFAPHRRFNARVARETKTYRRSGSKVGRNDPCPCGSGMKSKRCCGQMTIH